MTLIALKLLLGNVWSKFIWPVLSMTIPLPVFVILAVAAWAYFDKASAVRNAVDEAVTELVAGAELRKLQSTIDTKELRLQSLKNFAARARAREEALKTNNETLLDDLNEIDKYSVELQEKIDALNSMPTPDGCVATREFLDSLRD